MELVVSYIWLLWRCWPRWRGELAMPNFFVSFAPLGRCASGHCKGALNFVILLILLHACVSVVFAVRSLLRL